MGKRVVGGGFERGPGITAMMVIVRVFSRSFLHGRWLLLFACFLAGVDEGIQCGLGALPEVEGRALFRNRT